MLFPRVNREDAEKIFTVIHNVDADSITTGMGARYVGGQPSEDVSADGISAVKTDSAGDDPRMKQFAGIAKRDIPSDDFGIVQCWGAVDSVLMSHVGTSVTMGTFGGIDSTYLRPGPLVGTFFSGGEGSFTSIVPVHYQQGLVQLWNTTPTLSVAGYGKGFVRAL